MGLQLRMKRQADEIIPLLKASSYRCKGAPVYDPYSPDPRHNTTRPSPSESKIVSGGGMKRAQRALPASAALMVIVLVCGCSPSSPTSLPPPVISVSLTPAEQQTIQQNQTVGIVATVQGSSNNAVTWSLSGSGFLRSEEHTSELQSLTNLVCRLLLEKKKT